MRTLRPLCLLGCAAWLVATAPSWANPAGLPEFTTLVETYGPAVVNVSIKQARGRLMGPHGLIVPDLPEGSPLSEFFRRFLGEDGDLPTPSPTTSLGSGFILSPDGYIVTNAHVIEGAEEVIVRTSDRREFVATVIGSDARSDMALLKIDATDLPAVKLGSAKDLKVGEWVLAIGSPFGFEHSATAGIVSAKGRSLPSENYVPFIQTDAAINPGNSGGPLFNLAGEVVGVNSQIYSRTGGYMGLAFAVPIDVAMNVVEQLRTKGRVSRGWLGVMIQDVTRDLAESFGLAQPSGALIAQVLPDSPAAAAGLQVGDVILSFDGREVPTSGSLPPMVGTTSIGTVSPVVVLRGGERKEILVTIGELPEEPERVATAPAQKGGVDRLGLVVEDLTPERRAELGIDRGGVVVQRVEPGVASAAGIEVGDIILMIDNRPISNTAELRGVLDQIDSGRTVAVLIHRGDGRRFLALRLPAK